MCPEPPPTSLLAMGKSRTVLLCSGLALRLCGEDGVWNDTIDISDCSSENFINLQTMAVSLVVSLTR